MHTNVLRRRFLSCVSLLTFSLSLLSTNLTAQDAQSGKYSPDVVSKAEKFLEGVKLRRSGKTIQSTDTAIVSRAISGLAREKRKLRLVRQEWQLVVDRLAALRLELQRLNAQTGELSLQLARVPAGDVTANNRIVGLLNATNALTKAKVTEREQTKKLLSAKRDVLDDAETKYAETILAIRRDFTAARDKLAVALADQKVQIALKVIHANFETPEGLDADKILAALDKRIQRIEQEIFSESIPLDSERGSLYVDVVVGKKMVRMVVDSGASLVTLPIKTASELGIVVPIDARVLKMVLADGRSIPARAVTLPRMRVGEFEAENVEAAVLDAAASNAEPLLGLSFLRNFKTELDPAGKTLKMLRVDAD
jgi:clan AA aspartic protease (TIGR02281 family)